MDNIKDIIKPHESKTINIIPALLILPHNEIAQKGALFPAYQLYVTPLDTDPKSPVLYIGEILGRSLDADAVGWNPALAEMLVDAYKGKATFQIDDVDVIWGEYEHLFAHFPFYESKTEAKIKDI
jgi:hypothetical protein